MKIEQERHEKSLATVTKLNDSKVRGLHWFSRRTHGTLLTARLKTGAPATIIHTRDKISRNRRVSVAGGPVMKFKHTDLYRSGKGIPFEVF